MLSSSVRSANPSMIVYSKERLCRFQTKFQQVHALWCAPAKVSTQKDQRMKFRDYVGHVRSWDGQTLEMTRDAAANGSRPEQRVSIPADTIVTVKPVPERSMTRPRP